MTRQNPSSRGNSSRRQLTESDLILPTEDADAPAGAVVAFRPRSDESSKTVEAPPVPVYYVEAHDRPTAPSHSPSPVKKWALLPDHLEDDANGNPIRQIAVHPLSLEATEASIGSTEWALAHAESLTDTETADLLRAMLPLSIVRYDAGMLSHDEFSLFERRAPGWTEPAVRFALGYPLDS